MMTRRSLLRHTLALPAAALVAGPARAGAPEVYHEGGVALGGTDPVAYFTHGAPVPGSAAEALRWRGAVWQFASEANRVAFEMNPVAFAPRYGGYCALAMAEGRLAATAPEAWTIHGDRLYLNASLAVRQVWRSDIPGHVAQADGHWPAALG